MRPSPPNPTAPSQAMDERSAWDSVAGGALVLTVSAGLAARLNAEYQQRQLTAGAATWPSPAIVPLALWLERTWTRCGDRLLLSPAQEQSLWQQSVAACTDEVERAMTDLPSIARSASDAWKTWKAWQGEGASGPVEPDWEHSDGTRAFHAWAGMVTAACQRHGWTTSAELAANLLVSIASKALPAPTQVWLAGFDEPTPQQQRLLQALRMAGSRVEHWPRSRDEAQLSVRSAPDAETEIRAAATWARQQLKQRKTAPDGEAALRPPIGVIVPELARLRPVVARVFRETFTPQRTPWEESSPPFHISLGVPLLHCPVIGAALLVLESATQRRLRPDAAAALIGSPFCAAAMSERMARARWRREIMGEQRAQIPAAALHDGRAWRQCPQFAAAFTRLGQVSEGWPSRQPASLWAESLAEALEALGWPGEASLSSAEYRAVEAWSKLLEALAGLDEVADAVTPPERQLSLAGALTWMRRLAAARIFQPQRQHGLAPVQVLGWLEAAGQAFDQVWVTGLHDRAIPAAAAPSPFLPRKWQIERELPHVTAQRELDHAQRTWQRLLRSARTVIASYPERDGQDSDVPLRPSPVLCIDSGVPVSLAATSLPTPHSGDKNDSDAFVSIDDCQGPPATKEEVSGGTAVIKAQAACAFQAFVSHRLHAADYDPAPVGLSALTRGTLLHTFFEAVWAELRDRAGLLALAPESASERQLLERCARQAVEAEALLRDRPAVGALELDRLVSLGTGWLALERKRKVDFRVLERESARTVDFAGLPLRLRPDRVDELADGSRVVLDYKSGEVSRGGWGLTADGTVTRPKEPQLPLYLVTDPEPERVVAIAFAQLKPGQMSLKAMAAQKGLFTRAEVPVLPEDWARRIAAWRAELERLAQDFLGGRAEIDPLDPVETCERCGLGIVCRIREHDRGRSPRVLGSSAEEEGDGA